MARDVAVIVNTTDGRLTLPTFYLSKSDEESNKNPQIRTLGASADRGIINTEQPELPLNAYSFGRLKDHPIVLALAKRGILQFRAPNLAIALDMGT
tara:strand:+ start:377 stop:664 length:288 start_codon:yes stop_codon:yes gene_type:complete